MSGVPNTSKRSQSNTRSNRSRSLSAIRSRISSRSSRSSSSRSRSNRSTGSHGSTGQLSEFEGMVHQGQRVDDEFDSNTQKRTKVLEKPFVEKFKDNVWNNDGAWIKTFLILSCSSAVIILAFECALFGIFLVNFRYEIDTSSYNPLLAIYGFYQAYLREKRYAVAAYLALYIYAEIYQVLMTLVVLYTRNVFHLFSSILFLIIMAVYSGIQYNEMITTLSSLNAYQDLFEAFKSMLDEDQPIGTVKGLSIVVMALCCITCIVQAFVGWKLKDKFQQATGETIGNSRKKVSANVFFNIHRDALMLAFFFCPGFFLQAVVIAPNKGDAEFACSIAALVVSIFVILAADFFAAREKKAASITSTVWYILFTAFIIVKLVRLRSDHASLPGGKSVLAFGVITAVLLLLLILVSFKVITNFGEGLYTIYAKNYNWISKATYVEPVRSYDDLENNYEKSPLNGASDENDHHSHLSHEEQIQQANAAHPVQPRVDLDF